MCGFICSYGDDIPNTKELLQSISHRGPDSSQTIRSKRWSMSFARLSIVGDSNIYDQPYTENSRTYLLFNGEIYNFKKLRKELEHSGHQFKTNGDTEVILKSYAEWGENFLNKLEGMFAFCIWDEKEKKILLARDKLGEKPLFYYFVSFGSERLFLAIDMTKL